MHGFKKWEQKRDKKRQKTIGSKTMFVRIVTNCKKYNKVIVKSTIRLVYILSKVTMFEDIVYLACVRARARPRVRPRVYPCARAPYVRVCARAYVRPCARAYVPTKSLKNQPSQGKTDPPPSKKIPFSDRGPSRQTAIVPKTSNYSIRFLIFVPTLTF